MGKEFLLKEKSIHIKIIKSFSLLIKAVRPRIQWKQGMKDKFLVKEG